MLPLHPYFSHIQYSLNTHIIASVYDAVHFSIAVPKLGEVIIRQCINVGKYCGTGLVKILIYTHSKNDSIRLLEMKS
jgi:hypothetical protein